MKRIPRPTALILFGLSVIVSGLMRYFGQDGGEKGLWFGLTMGCAAAAGGLLLARGRRSGWGLAIPTVALVGGWFFN